ncbi:MAG: aminopeptidase [Gammaproteobacteria bacterium]|nr:aminopeptidase [Gammaproteobacteria bacterium]
MASMPLMQSFRRPLLTLGFALLVLGLISGCESISYYGQAAQGQMSLLLAREPIAERLTQHSLPDAERRKLQLVLDARVFAEQTLLLDAGDSYLSYVELERPFVLWNVFAAPEFSTSPVNWCYPIAGCVSYRGYFAETAARRAAARLTEDGFDVYSGGVDAYSTLGWFADPLTSSVLRRSEHGLVALLFHELAHRRVYVPGDTTFNESFATFVEQEGLRRWLQANSQAGSQAGLKESVAQQIALEDSTQAQFVALVTGYRDRLTALYAESLEPMQMRARKEAIQQELRDEYAVLRQQWGYAGYDRWFAGPLNNAQLATVASYNDLVPAFAALLEEVGGDLEQFYERVMTLVELPEAERREVLESLL